MSTSEARRPDGVVWAMMLWGGCLSTEPPGSELSACWAAARVAAPESVVATVLEGPYETCNAVVIAPTLLLTLPGCVSHLVSNDPNAGFEPPQCDTASGALREDGRFIDRFSMAPAVVRVLDEIGAFSETRVVDIFLSEGSSACASALAVLEVQPPLARPAASLRLETKGLLVDTPATLVGFDLSYSRYEAPAIVVDRTSEQGIRALVPRTFSLESGACSFPGGAVISPESGALIGLLHASSRTRNCVLGEGDLPAAPLAPFRQFLLETASSVGATLQLEPAEGAAGGQLPACAAEIQAFGGDAG